MGAGYPAIDMRPKDAVLVQALLERYVPNVAVWAFGSRTTGNAKKYSDLDIVLVSERRIPFSTLTALEAAFEESDLPFKVDVLELAGVTPVFREIIERQKVLLRSGDQG